MKNIIITLCSILALSACGFKAKSPINGKGQRVFIESSQSQDEFEITLRNELAQDQFMLATQKQEADLRITITHKHKQFHKPNRQNSDQTRAYPVEVIIQYTIDSHEKSYHETLRANGQIMVTPGQTIYTGQQLKHAYQSLYNDIAHSIAEQLMDQATS